MSANSCSLWTTIDEANKAYSKRRLADFKRLKASTIKSSSDRNSVLEAPNVRSTLDGKRTSLNNLPPSDLWIAGNGGGPVDNGSGRPINEDQQQRNDDVNRSDANDGDADGENGKLAASLSWLNGATKSSGVEGESRGPWLWNEHNDHQRALSLPQLNDNNEQQRQTVNGQQNLSSSRKIWGPIATAKQAFDKTVNGLNVRNKDDNLTADGSSRASEVQSSSSSSTLLSPPPPLLASPVRQGNDLNFDHDEAATISNELTDNLNVVQVDPRRGASAQLVVNSYELNDLVTMTNYYEVAGKQTNGDSYADEARGSSSNRANKDAVPATPASTFNYANEREPNPRSAFRTMASNPMATTHTTTTTTTTTNGRLPLGVGISNNALHESQDLRGSPNSLGDNNDDEEEEEEEEDDDGAIDDDELMPNVEFIPNGAAQDSTAAREISIDETFAASSPGERQRSLRTDIEPPHWQRIGQPEPRRVTGDQDSQHSIPGLHEPTESPSIGAASQIVNSEGSSSSGSGANMFDRSQSGAWATQIERGTLWLDETTETVANTAATIGDTVQTNASPTGGAGGGMQYPEFVTEKSNTHSTLTANEDIRQYDQEQQTKRGGARKSNNAQRDSEWHSLRDGIDRMTSKSLGNLPQVEQNVSPPSVPGGGELGRHRGRRRYEARRLLQSRTLPTTTTHGHKLQPSSAEHSQWTSRSDKLLQEDGQLDRGYHRHLPGSLSHSAAKIVAQGGGRQILQRDKRSNGDNFEPPHLVGTVAAPSDSGQLSSNDNGPEGPSTDLDSSDDEALLWTASQYLYMRVRAYASSSLYGVQVDVEWSNEKERTNQTLDSMLEQTSSSGPIPAADMAPFSTIDLVAGQDLHLQCTAQALGRLPEVKWYKRVYDIPKSLPGEIVNSLIRTLGQDTYWPITHLGLLGSGTDRFVCSQSLTIFDNLLNQTFTVINSLKLSRHHAMDRVQLMNAGDNDDYELDRSIFSCMVDADVRHDHATLGVRFRQAPAKLPTALRQRLRARSLMNHHRQQETRMEERFEKSPRFGPLPTRVAHGVDSTQSDGSNYNHLRQDQFIVPLQSTWIPVRSNGTYLDGDGAFAFESYNAPYGMMSPVMLVAVIVFLSSSLIALIYLTLKSYKALTNVHSDDEDSIRSQKEYLLEDQPLEEESFGLDCVPYLAGQATPTDTLCEFNPKSNFTQHRVIFDDELMHSHRKSNPHVANVSRLEPKLSSQRMGPLQIESNERSAYYDAHFHGPDQHYICEDMPKKLLGQLNPAEAVETNFEYSYIATPNHDPYLQIPDCCSMVAARPSNNILNDDWHDCQASI